ncbi:hypothetical protein EYZ11_011211 [Aspergillus tanneri]|nr:hypothetical protein EYZ11_011211 [Aspergillus tanneri]
MLQIAHIAALHEHKTKVQQEGHLVNTGLEEAVSDIRREIQSAFTQAASEGFSFPDSSNTGMTSNSTLALDSCTLVTHMFSRMASIYLHLVAYGFQKLELLDTDICTAMGMLYTQVPSHLLRSMVCPLYVIGSVARQEEERVFFRNVFSSPPLQDPLFEHRAKILPALEEIWRRRQYTNGLTWGDSLELVPNLLLL